MTEIHAFDPDGTPSPGAEAGVSAIMATTLDPQVASFIGAPTETATALDRAYRRGVSVLEYGAVGDGITDDTLAIQAALDNADLVTIPAGTYKIATLNITRSGVTLRGDGRGATALLSTAGAPLVSAVGPVGDFLRDIHLSDMTLAGNSASNQVGVSLMRVRDSSISMIRATMMGNNGINVFASNDVTVRGVEADRSRDFGILVFQSEAITVESCHIHTMLDAARAHLGIQFKSSRRCRAVDNNVHDIAGYGIYTWTDGTQADEGHQIARNTIRSMTAGAFAGTGIYINLSGTVSVLDNNVTDCAGSGISVAGAPEPIVRANRVSGSGALPGIGVSSGTARGSIVENHVTGYQQGIVLDAASDVTVSKNKVLNLSAGASTLNAAIRVRNSSNRIIVEDNLCSDGRGTPQMSRGIYQESGTGCEYRSNRCFGATVADVTLVGSAVSVGNVASAGPVAYSVGGSAAWPTP